MLTLIGDGTYGLVYLAINRQTGERVAVKTMKRKYETWDEVGACDFAEGAGISSFGSPL